MPDHFPDLGWKERRGYSMEMLFLQTCTSRRSCEGSLCFPLASNSTRCYSTTVQLGLSKENEKWIVILCLHTLHNLVLPLPLCVCEPFHSPDTLPPRWGQLISLPLSCWTIVHVVMQLGCETCIRLRLGWAAPFESVPLPFHAKII